MMWKLLIAGLLLSGCATMAGGEAVSVTKCGDTVLVRSGDPLLIYLESQVTSGYLWRLVSQSSGILHSLGDPETVWPQNQPDIDGSPELQLFRFKTGEVGTDVLLFHNVHPWSPDRSPLKTCTIRVTVENEPN